MMHPYPSTSYFNAANGLPGDPDRKQLIPHTRCLYSAFTPLTGRGLPPECPRR